MSETISRRPIVNSLVSSITMNRFLRIITVYRLYTQYAALSLRSRGCPYPRRLFYYYRRDCLSMCHIMEKITHETVSRPLRRRRQTRLQATVQDNLLLYPCMDSSILLLVCVSLTITGQPRNSVFICRV